MGTQLIRWDTFYSSKGKIIVKIIKDNLSSDEAIVALIAHEMHELNNLRILFEENGGVMSAGRLSNLISEGIAGNLHHQAWNVADDLVREMRKQK